MKKPLHSKFRFLWHVIYVGWQSFFWGGRLITLDQHIYKAQITTFFIPTLSIDLFFRDHDFQRCNYAYAAFYQPQILTCQSAVYIPLHFNTVQKTTQVKRATVRTPRGAFGCPCTSSYSLHHLSPLNLES